MDVARVLHQPIEHRLAFYQPGIRFQQRLVVLFQCVVAVAHLLQVFGVTVELIVEGRIACAARQALRLASGRGRFFGRIESLVHATLKGSVCFLIAATSCSGLKGLMK